MTEGTQAKEYYALKEAVEITGIPRSSLYLWIKRLDLEIYKFTGSRDTFLTASDVDWLKRIKNDPSQAGVK